MTDWLRSVVENASLQSWLFFDIAAKGSLCLLSVALVVLLLRRASAATRHLLWQFGFVAILILPLLSILLPRMNVLPRWHLSHTTESADHCDETTLPVMLPSLTDDEIVAEASPDDLPIADVPEVDIVEGSCDPLVQSTQAIDSQGEGFRLSPFIYGFAAWLIGALVTIAPAVTGHLCLWRIRRRSREVTCKKVLRQVAQAKRAIGLWWQVRTLESDRQIMPMTWGVLRSTILLPVDVSHWSNERLRMVLLHELSHIRRRDCLWQWVAQVACVIYWWHPIVWYAAHRMRVEREQACDDLVLSAGIRASDYAEQLLDISTGCRRNVLAMCAGITMAHSSQLKIRLYAILNQTIDRRSPARSLVFALRILFVALMFPLAMIDWAQAVQPKLSESNPSAEAEEQTTEPRLDAKVKKRDRSAYIAPRPVTWSAELPRYDTVDFSPDGKLLAAGSGFNREEGDIVVWELETHREVFTVPDHYGVRAVKFSPDGKLLAAASFDRNVHLFDVAQWKKVAVLHGHTVGADSIAFTPDGKILASGGRDKLIKLWDIASRKEIKTLRGHDHRVSFLEFSSNGRILASSSEDKTARLWDVSSGKTLHKLRGHLYAVEKIRFSPDNEQVATASWDRTTKLWNVTSGKEVATLPEPQQSILSVAFSPDGKSLITGGREGILDMWDLETQQRSLARKGHSSRAYCIAIHPDGTKFATAGWDRTVKLWDAKTFKELAVMPRRNKNELPQPVTTLDWSPDGQTVATADDNGGVLLRDAKTGRVKSQLQGHEDVVTTVHFSSDGKTLATGSYDYTIRLWDVKTGKERSTLEGHENLVYAVRFSPNGKQLASGGYDRTIRLWDTASGSLVKRLTGHEAAVRALAFSSDGSQLASAGSDRAVQIWDIETGKAVRVLEGHTSIVRAVEFSPDDSILATASEDHTIKLWDAETGKERQSLTDHQERVTCLAFSPLGKTLASGGKDNRVRLWDPETGESRNTLWAHIDAVSRVRFSPDGSQLLSGGLDGRFYLWKAQSPPTSVSKTLQTNSDKLKCRFCITSPDGQFMVTGGDDTEIKVWDGTTHKQLRSFEAGRSTCGAISPDGKVLATGTYNQLVYLWDLETGEQLGEVTTSGRSLAISFSPDSRFIATGHSNRSITVCDVQSRTQMWVSSAQELPVTSVAFSPESKMLATTTGGFLKWQEPGEVKLWDVESGNPLKTLTGHMCAVRCARFSPDGSMLVTGGDDRTLRIWDVGKLQLHTVIETNARLGSLAVLPDARSVVTGHYCGRVLRWDINSGRMIANYISNVANTSIYQVSCSPDGSLISTACSDGAVRIWPAKPKSHGSHAH